MLAFGLVDVGKGLQARCCATALRPCIALTLDVALVGRIPALDLGAAASVIFDHNGRHNAILVVGDAT